MQLVIPREIQPGENRVSATPETVKKLVRLGAEVVIESGAGTGAGISDADYKAAGASISSDRSALLGSADMVLRLRKPEMDEISQLKAGCIHVSYLDPFNEKDLIKAFANQNVTTVSMEMIPRSTRSQKMDALSSQANLAGYMAVMLAANNMPSIMPMMMTPAGTLKPAKVFIIGAGVAGLQAIATAKRLGARVTAFDTRPVVAEQVESLGAKFLEIDLGDTGQTADGYAKELTPEQVEIQRQTQKAVIADSDVVITTAQVFGRKPPVLVTADMVEGMSPGSVIVDMAAETGGNVDGSVPDEVVNVNGVTIVGTANLANLAPSDATQMYASNMFNLVEDTWDEDTKQFVLNLENDILPGCVITHGGEVVHPTIKDIIEGGN
ncbi:Re/Si-specific NAD(P)(+) transhydrogenase subunit alpha [Luminiphilus sp.]|nr:Re/Si-specific NAD(P)(+) transhydrogenase subunit alpha [Luminiphilus sp.]MDA9711107.1 Re/Si-specific NAD(P)(+) transhydrogenase subunit alpha [Luminiphilus sp.]